MFQLVCNDIFQIAEILKYIQQMKKIAGAEVLKAQHIQIESKLETIIFQTSFKSANKGSKKQPLNVEEGQRWSDGQTEDGLRGIGG